MAQLGVRVKTCAHSYEVAGIQMYIAAQVLQDIHMCGHSGTFIGSKSYGHAFSEQLK